MRIDLHYGPQSTGETDRSSNEKTNAAANASPEKLQSQEDLAQLSGVHAQVQALASEVLQMPEIRQQRIQSLREAVEGGQYEAIPAKTAAALMTHMGLSITR